MARVVMMATHSHSHSHAHSHSIMLVKTAVAVAAASGPMMRMMVTVWETHLHVSCNFHIWRRRMVVVAMMMPVVRTIRITRPMVGLMLTINLNRIILRLSSFIILVIIFI